MFKQYITNKLASYATVAAVFFATQAWSQTVKITQVPLSAVTNKIVNGSSNNSIYALKIEVGAKDVRLNNLTVNFAGTLLDPAHAPSTSVYIYEDVFTPSNPDNDYNTYYYISTSVSTTGGYVLLNSSNISLLNCKVYYLFVEVNPSASASVAKTVSVSMNSLAEIALTYDNNGTTTGTMNTGSVGAGNTYTVVAPSVIVTQMPIAGKLIATNLTSAEAVLAYKVEAPSDIVSYTFQSSVDLKLTGTYSTLGDNMYFRLFSSEKFPYNRNSKNNYSNNYNTVSNTGSETINMNLYESIIYRTQPYYVYLVLDSYTPTSVVEGHTFTPSLDFTNAVPSVSGTTFVGNTFTLGKLGVPTVSIPAANNRDTTVYIKDVNKTVYTVAITAPADREVSISNMQISISGIGNTINDFVVNNQLYIGYASKLLSSPTEVFTGNYQAQNYTPAANTTVTTRNLSLSFDGGNSIPAGQTRYVRLTFQTAIFVADKKIQVLGIESINNTTFLGTSAAGGMITTRGTYNDMKFVSPMRPTSVSSSSILPIYEFTQLYVGSGYSRVKSMVITLTGDLEVSSIYRVMLYFNNNTSIENNLKFENAVNYVEVYNPSSKVITFSGFTGATSYDYDLPVRIFVAIQLNDNAHFSAIGKKIGMKALDLTRFVFDENSGSVAPSLTASGTGFMDGKTYTYKTPKLTANNVPVSGGGIGFDQTKQPIFGMKLTNNGSFLLNRIEFNISGTYTSFDVSSFYIYSSESPVFDINNANNITSTNSNGNGETIYLYTYSNLTKTTYYFLVPQINASGTATAGRTIKVSATPMLYNNNDIEISNNLPSEGNEFTIEQPNVSLRLLGPAVTTMARSADLKVATIEVTSNVETVLKDLVLKTHGMYNSANGGRFTIYVSKTNINSPTYTNNQYNYNDNFGSKSYNIKIGNVTTTTGEEITFTGSDFPITKGKTYLTMFFNASSMKNSSSIGIEGIVTSATGLSGGETLKFINNVPQALVTITTNIIMAASTTVSGDSIYRTNNKLLYTYKYVNTAAHQGLYFGFDVKGTYMKSDLRTGDGNSIKIWMSDSPVFNAATAMDVTNPANGGFDIDLGGTYYEAYNDILTMNFGERYFHVTVDVSPTAVVGRTFQVIGGTFDDDFYTYPNNNQLSSSNYVTDLFNSVMKDGPMVPIKGGIDPNAPVPVPSTSVATATASVSTELSVYPNPSTGLFTISGAFDSATAYNMLGTVVGSTTTSALDLSGANEGVYFVKIVTGKSSTIKKVVITK